MPLCYNNTNISVGCLLYSLKSPIHINNSCARHSHKTDTSTQHLPPPATMRSSQMKESSSLTNTSC